MQRKKRNIVFGAISVMVVLGAAGALGCHISALGGKRQMKELYISEEEVTVPGLEREYHLFFMADSHISLCDERDAQLMDKAQ